MIIAMLFQFLLEVYRKFVGKRINDETEKSENISNEKTEKSEFLKNE